MKPKNSKKNLWIVSAIFGFFLLAGICLFLYKTATGFEYEKHLEDWIISVDGEKVTLREFGYYILIMERDTQETALTYDAECPMNYWNLYIGTAGKIGYVRNISKEYAIEYCIRDKVYQQIMESSEFTFPQEVMEEIEEKVILLAEDFSETQLRTVGLTKEQFMEKAREIEVVHQFLESYTESGIKAEELDISGEYYQEVCLDKDILTNQELADAITFGSITVN